MHLTPCIVYVATILAAPLSAMSLPSSSIGVSLPITLNGNPSITTIIPIPVPAQGENHISKLSSNSKTHLQKRDSSDLSFEERQRQLNEIMKNTQEHEMKVAASLTHHWYANQHALQGNPRGERPHVPVMEANRYFGGREQELTPYFKLLNEARYLDGPLKERLKSAFGIVVE